MYCKVPTFLLVLLLVYSCRNDHPSYYDQYLADYQAPDDLWQIIDLDSKTKIKSGLDNLKIYTEGLLPINIHGLWGYLDTSGATIIEPQFIEAFPFCQSLARVRHINGKFGIIDLNGKFVIQPKYSLLGDYSNGVIRAVRPNGMHQFIDHRGNDMGFGEFEEASDFSANFARIRIGQKWHLLTIEGDIIAEGFDNIILTSDSSSPIPVRQEEMWGYIDRHGNFVSKCDYEQVNHFIGKYAGASRNDSSIIIDVFGNEILSLKGSFEHIGHHWLSQRIDDHYKIVSFENKACGTVFKEIHKFNTTHAIAHLEEGHCTLVNIEGSVKEDIDYPLILEGGKNLFRMVDTTGMGIIDTAGKHILSPIYENIKFLGEGRVALL
jgi:hypothetical protein